MVDFLLIDIQIVGLVCDRAASCLSFGGDAGLIEQG
jgi:hypothetical protein